MRADALRRRAIVLIYTICILLIKNYKFCFLPTLHRGRPISGRKGERKEESVAENWIEPLCSFRPLCPSPPTVPLAAHCANTKAPRAEGECSRVAFGGNIRLSLLDGTGGAPLKRYRAPLWRQPDLRRKGERSALSLGGRVAGLR